MGTNRGYKDFQQGETKLNPAKLSCIPVCIAPKLQFIILMTTPYHSIDAGTRLWPKLTKGLAQPIILHNLHFNMKCFKIG
jgi:hypothetical protein